MSTLAPDSAESQRVREVLREWEASRPDVVMLAMFASLARQIEPELLRALRLKLKRFGDATQPWPTVGTEAALWFSPFVESRGAESITLQAEFSALLRAKLQQWGKPPGVAVPAAPGAIPQRNELMEAAREIIVQFHATAPSVTRWEEDLIYLATSEEGEDVDRHSQIDREVWRAVKALATGQRRGLGEWIAEMGPRLPQTAQNTPLMARLQAATHSALAQKTTSPGTLHLGGIDFADVPSRVLEVARVTAGFRVGDLLGKGQFGIRVPDVEPVTIQLLPSDSSGETRTIIIPTGGTAEIPTRRGETCIRTIDGRIYALERGVAGDSRAIAGIPYARAEFDKTGKLLNRVTIPHGTTDLIVIAHSWNNTVADAEELYSKLFENFAKVTEGDEAIRRRKLAILGVLWPAKRFGQPAPPAEESAQGERASSQVAMRQSIDDAASISDDDDDDDDAGDDDDDDDAEKLAHMSNLTADLDENSDAQKDLVRMHAREAAPADVQSPEKDTPRGATTGGITGFFGSLVSGATNVLNYMTYFEMQKRAEAIGTAGMAPLLDRLDRQLKGIHLVGYSFGARLVVAAAAHSKTPKLHSLTLIQAALSHYALSIKYSGQFSGVIGEQRIVGPILVTFTENDKALGTAYPSAARLAGEKASGARARPISEQTSSISREHVAQEGVQTVRLYHGSSKEAPQAGSDFTPSLEYAEGYAKKSINGGMVWYVDVPADSLFLKRDHENGGYLLNQVLPDEIADLAKPVTAAPLESAAVGESIPSGTEGTRGFGRAGDKFGAMGFNGALGMAAEEVSATETRLRPVGETYQWKAGCIHNLDSNRYIPDHQTITGPEIAWALSRAIAPSIEPRITAKQILYEGNMQGVGFRYTAGKIAKGFAVNGWVRNLPDGRVEIQVSGEPDEVAAFLEGIAQSELRPHIRKQTETPLTEPPAARGFEIRR